MSAGTIPQIETNTHHLTTQLSSFPAWFIPGQNPPTASPPIRSGLFLSLFFPFSLFSLSLFVDLVVIIFVVVVISNRKRKEKKRWPDGP